MELSVDIFLILNNQWHIVTCDLYGQTTLGSNPKCIAVVMLHGLMIVIVVPAYMTASGGMTASTIRAEPDRSTHRTHSRQVTRACCTEVDWMSVQWRLVLHISVTFSPNVNKCWVKRLFIKLRSLTHNHSTRADPARSYWDSTSMEVKR